MGKELRRIMPPTTLSTKSKSTKRRCTKPVVSDTIHVYIPLDVTADLGVAMKRTREKRIRKLKRLHPFLFPDKHNPDPACDASVTKNGDGNGSGLEDEMNDLNNDNSSKKSDSALEFLPQRDQYGSVLDYLEAKYVRGVMLPDLDAKMERKQDLKKEKKKKEAALAKKKKKEENGEDEDGSSDSSDGSSFLRDDDSLSMSSSDGGRSCYSDESGAFLDDSLLRAEVAEQALASSCFTSTKIEAEAKKSKKKRKVMGTMDDDDGFFVNVGDLEMAEGYEEAQVNAHDIDFEALASPTKKNKKKDSKQSSTTQKRKRKIKADTIKPSSTTSQEPAATKKQPPSKINVKKIKATDKKKHKQSSKTIPLDPKLKALKQVADKLKKEQLRLYKRVVEEISKLTEEHLPRATTSNSSQSSPPTMIKVSITVPPNKSPGDSITFSNPRIPSQKLRVKIPQDCQSGEKFVVSVPVGPSSDTEDHGTKTNPKENTFSKPARDVLDEYSRKYDQWIDAESFYRESLLAKQINPTTENKNYKPNKERMKKFDKLFSSNVFPDDLAVKIDPTFLRKVVRRTRQNSSKRRKNLQMPTPSVGESVSSKEKEAKKRLVNVPGSGRVFEKVIFENIDFVMG